MKKGIKFFLVCLLGSVLNANLVQNYLNKNYKENCSFNNINKYKNNEKALSIIGVSCIKTDSIYLLPYIINKLKHTDYGRKNSIYFLTVLMQKKLLYSYLFDGMPIKSFSFPLTDYVLSYVFEAIRNGNFTKNGDIIIINNKQKGLVYKFYKKEDKMFIDEYKDKELIKRRWYR